MAERVQLRRRLSGAAGPPPAAETWVGELHYNQMDQSLWIGEGADPAPGATSTSVRQLFSPTQSMDLVRTTQDFVVPDVDETVSIIVNRFNWGERGVWVMIGGEIYQVEDIVGTVVTIRRH